MVTYNGSRHCLIKRRALAVASSPPPFYQPGILAENIAKAGGIQIERRFQNQFVID